MWQLDQIDYDQEMISYYGKDDTDFLDVDPQELQERLDNDPLYQDITKFLNEMEVI